MGEGPDPHGGGRGGQHGPGASSGAPLQAPLGWLQHAVRGGRDCHGGGGGQATGGAARVRRGQELRLGIAGACLQRRGGCRCRSHQGGGCRVHVGEGEREKFSEVSRSRR